MSNAVQAYNAVVRAVERAEDWSQERVEFVRREYCGGAPDAIASAFIDICRRRRLAPEERQIYLTKRGQDWVIQTGIDGYRLIADRTRAYAGSDDAEFDSEDAEHPGKATVTVWKMVAGLRRPFTASARWAEYAPADARQGFMWKKMPYLMLGKCAESLALRKAFPAELCGIYTDAEMDQAGAESAGPFSAVPSPARPAPIGSEVIDAETGEMLDAGRRHPAPQKPRMIAQVIRELFDELEAGEDEQVAFLEQHTGKSVLNKLTAKEGAVVIQTLSEEVRRRRAAEDAVVPSGQEGYIDAEPVPAGEAGDDRWSS